MTLVVKIGGAPGNESGPLFEDLAHRSDYVLVHGGSAEVDRLGSELGRPSEYYTSPSGVVSRRSDPPHLEVVVLALAGKVQTELVAGLAQHGVPAIGLSGVDGSLLLARRKEGARAVRNGRVFHLHDERAGALERVNGNLLRVLLAAHFAPVVGPPALTPDGEIVNVDADRVAARIAIDLGAPDLVFLTNVPGLLRDPIDPGSRVGRIVRSEFEGAMALARGRMRKKLVAVREALDGGVRRVCLASSQGPRPVERALGGEGTVFE